MLAKTVPEAEDFFAMVELLYCFLSTSVVYLLWNMDSQAQMN